MYHRSAALVAALLFPWPVAAQDVVTLSGEVLEVRTGRPIAEAVVAADSLGRSTVSDSLGRFSLVLPPTPGRMVRLSVGGHCFESQLIGIPLGGEHPLDHTFRLMVSSEQLPAGLCREWWDVPAVRGRVTDSETGEPIRGVLVTVADFGMTRGGDITDEEGTYELTGLTTGVHRIQFHHQCYHLISTDVGYGMNFAEPVSLSIGLPFGHQIAHLDLSNDYLLGCRR